MYEKEGTLLYGISKILKVYFQTSCRISSDKKSVLFHVARVVNPTFMVLFVYNIAPYRVHATGICLIEDWIAFVDVKHFTTIDPIRSKWKQYACCLTQFWYSEVIEISVYMYLLATHSDVHKLNDEIPNRASVNVNI